MNLFYLRYFVTLAQVQHYTKAAEQLCIAQPSLSHAITQLEKELGVPLFAHRAVHRHPSPVQQGLCLAPGALRRLGQIFV